ncbi:MAG: trypsin-like peptidase domain-containing protein [Parcubacteria group bacterium]|nr:trypsin-like peptidase domain-containing protein [Parcubacteria group bacterium]
MKNKQLVGNAIFASALLLILIMPIAARGDPNDSATEEFFRNLHRSVPLVSVGDFTHGTAFVVTEDGFLLTNAHVVEDKQTVNIIFDSGETTERTYLARVILSDSHVDIAVLKIISHGAERFQYLSFGDTEVLVAGYSDIHVAGYPLSLGRTKLYVADGKVTQKNVLLDAGANIGLGTYFATGVVGGKGNSGSPCLHKNKVVGVASAAATANNDTGLLFCISGTLAKEMLKTAIDGRPVIRGGLDVVLGEFPAKFAMQLDMYQNQSPKESHRVVVVRGHKSKFVSLDRIISISFNDVDGEHTTPIYTVIDFKRAVGNLSPTTFITVQIIRAGEEIFLQMNVEALIQENLKNALR